ncbi:hypothetical protein [Methylocucumis oryzae]|nr:hypothetical protein [Methylocucumis oryzae]
MDLAQLTFIGTIALSVFLLALTVALLFSGVSDPVRRRLYQNAW